MSEELPEVPAQTPAEEAAEPDYPPDTFRWMSWAAIKFIHRPTLRPLAWVCYGLMSMIIAGVVSIFFIKLDVRVESYGQVVASPGVLQAIARADDLMSAPRVSPGTRVLKGQVLGLLQMEMEEDDLLKAIAALEENIVVVEPADRSTGLDGEIEAGESLSELREDAAIRDAVTALQGAVRKLRESLEGLGAFEADKAEVLRLSRQLRGLLGQYLERHRLRSPTAGTLLQYEVEPNTHVKAGDAVASILPDGATLVASVLLDAKDVPNVVVGQRARHKLDAYPYQRYGLFEGEVTSIDRVQEKGELHYKVEATVNKPATLSERVGKNVHLVMGMKLQSQIITGNSTLYDILADSLFGKR